MKKRVVELAPRWVSVNLNIGRFVAHHAKARVADIGDPNIITHDHQLDQVSVLRFYRVDIAQ